MKNKDVKNDELELISINLADYKQIVLARGEKVFAHIFINGDNTDFDEAEKYAQRIVDCVKACKGLKNPIEEMDRLVAGAIGFEFNKKLAKSINEENEENEEL